LKCNNLKDHNIDIIEEKWYNTKRLNEIKEIIVNCEFKNRNYIDMQFMENVIAYF